MRESYKTRQKQILMEYIAHMGDGHFTAAQIAEHFAELKISIGQATIYRHLDKLVEEGTVKKYQLGKSSGACYQYIGSGECAGHYHFKCKKCNTILHVSCSELDAVKSHIQQEHKFIADVNDTIFIGTCTACSELDRT